MDRLAMTEKYRLSGEGGVPGGGRAAERLAQRRATQRGPAAAFARRSDGGGRCRAPAAQPLATKGASPLVHASRAMRRAAHAARRVWPPPTCPRQPGAAGSGDEVGRPDAGRRREEMQRRQRRRCGAGASRGGRHGGVGCRGLPHAGVCPHAHRMCRLRRARPIPAEPTANSGAADRSGATAAAARAPNVNAWPFLGSISAWGVRCGMPWRWRCAGARARRQCAAPRRSLLRAAGPLPAGLCRPRVEHSIPTPRHWRAWTRPPRLVHENDQHRRGHVADERHHICHALFFWFHCCLGFRRPRTRPARCVCTDSWA